MKNFYYCIFQLHIKNARGRFAQNTEDDESETLRDMFEHLFSESDPDKDEKSKKASFRKLVPKRKRVKTMGVHFHGSDEEFEASTQTKNAGPVSGKNTKVATTIVQPYTPPSVAASDSDVTITSAETMPKRDGRGRWNRIKLASNSLKMMN